MRGRDVLRVTIGLGVGVLYACASDPTLSVDADASMNDASQEAGLDAQAASDAVTSDATATDGSSLDAGDAPTGDGASADASVNVPMIDLGVACGGLPASKCAVQIGLMWRTGCALLADGTVRCWGSNPQGETGSGVVDGGVVVPAVVHPAVTVSGVSNARQLAAHTRGACVLDGAGDVMCWGSNFFGQRGEEPDASSPPKTVAVRVVGLPKPSKGIFAGSNYTCATLTDDTVWCWGWNQYGQLAVVDQNDASPPTVVPPQRVTALEGAAMIGRAGNAFFVVQPDGGVTSFGINNNGQLGRGLDAGTLPFDPRPAPVIGLPSAALGIGHTQGEHQCAILDGGGLACWGRNDGNQLPAPVSAGDKLVPVTVPGVSSVVELAAGYTHSCVRVLDGGVSCWGSNGQRESGQDAGYLVTMPSHVSGLGAVVQLEASSNFFSCALERTGVVKCWGSSDQLQTGRAPDSGTSQATPTAISF